MSDIERAYDYLEDGEYQKAEELAQQLIQNGDLEGFFILTDIADDKDELTTCITILESAIKEYKDNWRLWMRLGNYQSDLEEFEDAKYSFERAQFLTGADVSLVKLNKAILATKIEDYPTTLLLIEEIKEDFPLIAYSLKLDILDEQEKYQEVLDTPEPEFFNNEEEKDEHTMSNIFFYLAHASHVLGMKNDTTNYLKLSLEKDRQNDSALWLRRELHGKKSTDNKYYHILIEGDYDLDISEEGTMKFFTSYDVISNSLKSALEEIKEFEPLDLNKSSFQIEEHEIVVESTTDPSGIYTTAGFTIFSKE